MSHTKFSWTHEKWCRPSDPINIIFEAVDLDEVEAFLLSQGWEHPPPLYAWSQVIPTPSPLEKSKQDLQLIRPIDTLFGKFRIWKRLHIRLWNLEHCIIASVHIDAPRVFRHSPTDFESVEKFFADICRKNPSWEVFEDHQDLDNRIAGHGQPFNNGKATVVRRKEN